jgi:hypothetical protein
VLFCEVVAWVEPLLQIYFVLIPLLLDLVLIPLLINGHDNVSVLDQVLMYVWVELMPERRVPRTHNVHFEHVKLLVDEVDPMHDVEDERQMEVAILLDEKLQLTVFLIVLRSVVAVLKIQIVLHRLILFVEDLEYVKIDSELPIQLVLDELDERLITVQLQNCDVVMG